MTEVIKLEDKEKHEDTYSKAIGEIGRWQICILVFVAFPTKLVLPCIHLGIVFLAPKTTFRCAQRKTVFDEIVNLTCYSDCKAYEYFSNIDNNIITQWNLVCERAWLADFVQMICMFGVVIGSAVFGSISDRYGRRLCLILAGSLETSMSFVMPFCPDFWSFTVVRFLLGAATGGTMLTSFVFLIEIFGANKRELIGSVFMFPTTVGHLLMALIAYYFRNWRWFSIGFAIPTLIFLTFVFWVPESPKWLISVGRLEEASAVMTSAAKWNKLSQINMKTTVESIANEGKSDDKTCRKPTLKELITLPSLRIKNLCSCLMWFTVGVGFFGSHQYFGQTSSNVFLVETLLGFIQFPGFIIGAYVSKVFGRRVAITSFFIITSIGNVILILPDEWYYLKLIAGVVGVSCGAAVFSLIYVFTSELFPTVARNMGIGTSSTANKIGSMLAPFIGGLRKEASWIPPVVFAVCPIIGIAACWCLPETSAKQLQDHLEEDN